MACDMCKQYKMKADFYLWRGIITKSECKICFRCAKREGLKNAK